MASGCRLEQRQKQTDRSCWASSF